MSQIAPQVYSLRSRVLPLRSGTSFRKCGAQRRSERFYTATSARLQQEPPQSHPSPSKWTQPAKRPGQDPTKPHLEHEVHEGTQAINTGFNPPGGGPGPGIGGTGVDFPITRSPLTDAALTTIIGLGMVFFGGIAYVKWYKTNVLNKIETAFAAGWDPALELAKPHATKKFDSDDEFAFMPEDEYLPDVPWTEVLRRKEQDLIDRVVKGEEPGHYFCLLGPKGSGKGSMVFDSMHAIQADGVAMCDAHPDLEVFRLRLGKALNYEYNEDSQTGLFQRRDPREGGAALDIERALHKLEKVAIRACAKRGKPFVLIINNAHFFKNDDDGRNMLLQLQQHAESWAASGILTVVFTTDDFWPFQVMRKTASRMHVVSVYDLATEEAYKACTKIHMVDKRRVPGSVTKEIVELVGGRLSYINRVCRSKDMKGMANHLLEVEKAWLLSQIGLIVDCDDDVMDEQKWSSSSWLLLQEFVRMRQEAEKERQTKIDAGADPEKLEELQLPKIPYWRCRQLMTRTDFIEDLDRKNIIAIDVDHNVRPESMLILHAARQVCEEEDFQEKLDSVRDRIDEIESLHRTRELTFKDMERGDKLRLSVDKLGKKFDEDEDD